MVWEAIFAGRKAGRWVYWFAKWPQQVYKRIVSLQIGLKTNQAGTKRCCPNQRWNKIVRIKKVSDQDGHLKPA